MNRFRRTIAIVLASTFALAMAAPVAAAKPTPTGDPAQTISSDVPAGMPEGGATVVSTTVDGVVLSSQSQTLYAGDTPEPLATIASASGCSTVDAWKNMYTALGFLAYRWHQTKYRCWSAGAITAVTIGHYISDSDGLNFYRGLLSSDKWYYSWNGNSKGGHYSIRQAIMENCIPILGCWVSKYPWVKIWVTANGSYTYAVGE